MNNLRSTERSPVRTALPRIVALLGILGGLLLAGACTFLERFEIPQQADPLPINMRRIYLFDLYEASIRIEAPVERVWATLVDPDHMVRLFASIDTLVFSPATGPSLERGTHFGFSTQVAGQEVQGTAVVTSAIPGSFLSFAVLTPAPNVTTITMQGTREGTSRVWLHMAVRALPRTLAVTAYDIRASIDRSLRRTLKRLKRFSEGKDAEPVGGPGAKARIEFRSEGLAPFDILHHREVFPVGIETINRYFLEREAYARVLQQLGFVMSRNLLHMLSLPGVGVPFTAEIGPFALEGIVVVTEVIPDVTLNVASFHSPLAPVRGGGNLRFFARGSQSTEMDLIEYYQIPDRFEGRPVDKQALEADLRNRLNELAHLAEWAGEKHRPKALLKSGTAP